jgi:hypothetical protein
VQALIGDRRLSGAIARETLRRLGTVAGTSHGENGFTFGLLYAAEQQAAELHA